jgi:hypothetical protein
LRDCDPQQEACNLLQCVIERKSAGLKIVCDPENAGRVGLRDRFEKTQGNRALDHTEHRSHVGSFDASRSERDRLVEQRQSVAHAAGSGLREQGQRLGLVGDRFCLEDLLQVLRDHIARHLLQIELQARLSTVTGTFCGSVVASTNLRCAGGSSSVFSMALNAWPESWCTSSIT